ncbi:MAG: hypothetical protein AB7O24_21975, partial [Kofleriaceae bacterium]
EAQARRYARHIVLADIGPVGQQAIMTARVAIAPTPWTPAELLTAQYLAAGGVGAIDITGTTEPVVAAIATRGPDTELVRGGNVPAREVIATPDWWPHAEGDTMALSFWRAGVTAARWLADMASPTTSRS